MSQAIRKRLDNKPKFTGKLNKRLKEGMMISLGGISVFLFLGLISHHPADPGWSQVSGANDVIYNLGGSSGAWFSDFVLQLFGQLSYLFPFCVSYLGWVVYREEPDFVALDRLNIIVKFLGLVMTIITGCALFWVRGGGVLAEIPHESGGIIGNLVGTIILNNFGQVGGSLLMLAAFLAGVTIFTGLSWLWLMDTVGSGFLYSWRLLVKKGNTVFYAFVEIRDSRAAKKERELIVENERAETRKEPVIRFRDEVLDTSDRLEAERQEKLFSETEGPLPELTLLDSPKKARGGYSHDSLNIMSRQVELKLSDFGIEVKVVSVQPGPVITRFELEPAAGVKASRITNLSKDLARALSAVSVRVVEVIPGKTCIGLEIPNQERETVFLSDILKSRKYDDSRSTLTIALGEDISGEPLVADLSKMPHLLVAGTTGSGKSVALNAMILSLLYKSTPEDVRFILIDPKMLELSVYEGIPSLLAPVVTDMKDAANALRWCVSEMEKRYQLMSVLGVRNIEGYNKKVSDAVKAGTPLLNPLDEMGGKAKEELEVFPKIVVIIDELADLMMVVGKKVEALIARLAQKARASGIHLILATQRPSVDVITGLIKANIPTRIAFQVSSRVDSRTILDQMGAENLLGHGDMLYLPPGTGIPHRVHGAFVSDEEVHKVVKRLKKVGKPQYLENVLSGTNDVSAGEEVSESGDSENDELYDKAVQVVLETRRASVSGVQRRLKIGYNRAARMVEAMEAAGLVGELQSNGTREILVPSNND